MPAQLKRTSILAETKLRVDEATVHVKNGNYGKAMALYKQALELSPDDVNALIARSKCYLLLGNPRNALQDVETALQRNLTNSLHARAIYYKAEALYYLGDFEMSLVYYYRGMKLRPEFEQFRLGAQKAKDSIKTLLRQK